jgi:hypothetical protein
VDLKLAHRAPCFLQSSNGKYLRVADDGTLLADVEKVPAVPFELIYLEDANRTLSRIGIALCDSQGRLVGADSAQQNQSLQCSADSLREDQIFGLRFLSTKPNGCALFSASGLYWRALDGGGDALRCDKIRVKEHETFRLFIRGGTHYRGWHAPRQEVVPAGPPPYGGVISIRCASEKHWVKVNKNGGLDGKAKQAAQASRLHLEVVDEKTAQVCLRGENGKYVSVNQKGLSKGALVCVDAQPGPASLFTFHSFRGNLFALEGSSKLFVHAAGGGGGGLQCKAAEASEWERFQIQYHPLERF